MRIQQHCTGEAGNSKRGHCKQNGTVLVICRLCQKNHRAGICGPFFGLIWGVHVYITFGKMQTDIEV